MSKIHHYLADGAPVRVLITGTHEWAGCTGEAKRVEETPVGPMLIVLLDNGIECGVFENGQIELLADEGQ